MPSFVARADFLPALAIPLVRKIPSALGRSPPLSTRARLQSIKPALVFSRSCFTSCGSISMIFIRLKRYMGLLCKRCNFCNAYLPSGGDAGHFDLLANARFVACRNDSVHELLQNHADSANRIIVASDWVIDDVGVRVGVYDGDYWNSKPSRFINSVLLADCVDHHKGIW